MRPLNLFVVSLFSSTSISFFAPPAWSWIRKWETKLHHDGYSLVVDAVVVYGRLQEVRVFFELDGVSGKINLWKERGGRIGVQVRKEDRNCNQC